MAKMSHKIRYTSLESVVREVRVGNTHLDVVTYTQSVGGETTENTKHQGCTWGTSPRDLSVTHMTQRLLMSTVHPAAN